MGQSLPMNGLLQGDVGSGKTVVALHAMLLAVDFTELFRILGISEEVELLRSDETVTHPEHTSSEHTVVEAVLKADSTGYWVKHPFVNSHLQRTLARWAFKLCTAGGLHFAGVRSGRRRIPGATRRQNLQRVRLDPGMEDAHQP